MSMGDGGPAQGLDFETAAAEGSAGALTCSGCQREISSQYFTAGEAILCDPCRHQLEAELRNQSASGRFMRAGFFGFIAALAGAALWGGVIWMTGYELGLIAVVVGFMVGAAVKAGTHGRGGLLYQFMAVGLTYLAVSLAYVPLVLQGFQQLAQGEEAAALENDGAAEAMPPLELAVELEGEPGAEQALVAIDEELAVEPTALEGEASFDESVAQAGMVGMLIVGVGALAVAAALPFLMGFQNIIGLAIIGFALWQAWSMNKKVDVTVGGPFQVGSGA